MDKFKNECIINAIVSFLTTGRPIPKLWIFPDFLKHNETMLKNFFGSAYDHYITLSTDEKLEAIKWFETSGENIVSFMNATCYKDWDDGEIPIFDLTKLKDENDIYEEIVKRVVKQVYSRFKPTLQAIIINKFNESPQDFTDEIMRNVFKRD